MQFNRPIIQPKAILFSLFAVAVFGFSISAEAHDVFKDPMKERFDLKTVSCSACHPGKDKDQHNLFGAMFVKAFKGKELTKKLEEAEAKGEKEKEAFEAIMVEEFMKALEVIEVKEPTMIAVVDAGLLVGTKKNKDALETLQERVVEFIESAAEMPLFGGLGPVDEDAPKESEKK